MALVGGARVDRETHRDLLALLDDNAGPMISIVARVIKVMPRRGGAKTAAGTGGARTQTLQIRCSQAAEDSGRSAARVCHAVRGDRLIAAGDRGIDASVAADVKSGAARACIGPDGRARASGPARFCQQMGLTHSWFRERVVLLTLAGPFDTRIFGVSGRFTYAAGLPHEPDLYSHRCVVPHWGRASLRASLGAILEARASRSLMVKLDPYINVDRAHEPFQAW